MIIVDSALEKRQKECNPVKVALVGAGYMGRGIALQIEQYITGMKLVAIANRTIAAAERAYREAGIEASKRVETVGQLETAIAHGDYAITDKALMLCQAQGIDAIIESTGDVEFSAHVELAAQQAGREIFDQ